MARRYGSRRIFGMTQRRFTTLIMTVIIAIASWLGIGSARIGGVVQAKVVRVVDGDTIVASVNGDERRVRMIGVDTPETVHPDKPVQFYGPEASAFTKRELRNRDIWLEYDVSPLDKYQRHLAYIWLADPEADGADIRRDMFNARLLLEGYARLMTIQPNSRYADVFTKFQREAREKKRGLWGKTEQDGNAKKSGSSSKKSSKKR